MRTRTAQVLAMHLTVIDGWLAYEVDLQLPDGSYRHIILDEVAGDQLIDRALEAMPPSLQRFARVP